ncbi:MAG: hypothetical protein QOH46_393, partial [Solirubrobacteraceae bacterium]|nr:hypothetical protein [Solirubrobacteraceae bacterium]
RLRLAESSQTAAAPAPRPGDEGGVPLAIVGGLGALAAAAAGGGTLAWRRRHGGADGRPAIG